MVVGKKVACGLASLVVLLLWQGVGIHSQAAEIDLATAQQVAEAQLQRHIDLHGTWEDTDTARIASGRTVHLEDMAVAHHFSVQPTGHVLVAADDRFSPVLLYSTSSTFDPANLADPDSIEAWILPEIASTLKGFENSTAPLSRAMNDSTVAGSAAERILTAWSHYLSTGTRLTRSLSSDAEALPRLNEGLIVGPMLSTRWGQSEPYNDLIPTVIGGCDHALTGCVATAFAQVMRYWQWPYNGEGGHSYQWAGETLSAVFEIPYDWAFMPDRLSGASAAAEIDAVAHLMFDVAVAVETDFGCNGSSSIRYGDEILDRFFRFKSQMVRHSRSRYSASDWFNLIQSELDAQPPRPMLFSIFTAGWSGHEVIIDGYQTGPTDKVHINLGWSGAYNGYYDITHNFTAAYEWQADYQVLVTGIEPDNTPPIVDAGGDQVVIIGQTVTLLGEAVDPDGFSMEQIQWVQRTGPLVSLSDAGSLQTGFTAPPVSVETDLEFELIANDPHGALVSDACTIRVYPAQHHPVAVAGTDQIVTSGSQVILAGNGLASEGHEIDTYTWFPPADADQRALEMTSVSSQEARFIAPAVEADTDLVFTLEVTDTSGQTAEDVCVVRVKAEAWASPTDAQPDVDASDGGDPAPGGNDTGGRSSGGGPCFLGALLY
jgi:hypothetical protein